MEKVFVERGAYVKKGQVVAQLESNLEQASVVLARARVDVDAAIKSGEARLAFSTLKVARSEKLFERQLISAADLDEAQTEKRLAEMALLSATDNRRLATLELERAKVACRDTPSVAPFQRGRRALSFAWRVHIGTVQKRFADSKTRTD